MPGYDYESILGGLSPVLNENMCYVNDWVEENLPMEDADGTSLEKEVEKIFQAQQLQANVLENFQKKQGKEAAFKFGKPEAPARETVLVFEDAGGLCREVLEKAPSGRVSQKKFVEGWGMTEQEVEGLIAGGGWSMVLFGSPLDLAEGSSTQAVIEHNTALSKLFWKVLRALYNQEGAVGKVAVLTRGQWSNDADDHNHAGLPLVAAGTMYGMCMTAKQELQQVGCILHPIDIEYTLAPAPTAGMPPQPPMALRIATEVFRKQTFGQATVRLLHSGRFVMRHVMSTKYENPKKRWLFPCEGTIGISGGNGALGLVMGGWLLEQAAKQKQRGFELINSRIEFLSRSAAISDDNLPMWAKIQKKAEELGVVVIQTKLDMSDQEKTDKYISSVTPNLVGFIHSAGVLRDAILMTVTWDKFEDVFNSKHRAALYLHDALQRYSNPKLQFLWMFSSVAVYGSQGQLNYSGSNSFLDNLCRHRVALGLPATTMQWGGWGEVGMASKLDEVMRARMNSGPMPSFSNARGLRGMEAGLRTSFPSFAVYQVNFQAFVNMVFATAATGGSLGLYMRLFYSDLIPPLPLPEVTDGDMYAAYVQGRKSTAAKLPRQLNMEKYGPEAVKALQSQSTLALN